MNREPKFQNGDEVKDSVTGLKGIIVVTSVWLNGCIRYSVQPQELKDGKPVEASSFDENELILVKSSKIKDSNPEKKFGGPPRNERSALKVTRMNRLLCIGVLTAGMVAFLLLAVWPQ